MKLILFALVLCLTSLSSRSQTPVDTLIATPNPFIKRTALNYSFTKNDTVTIHVFNQFGQDIVTLFTDSIMQQGSYQDTLKMDLFPDGGYIVQLKLGHRKSKLVKVIKSASADIAKISNEFFVLVYPNPTKDLLNLDFETIEVRSSKLTISNSLGEVVYYGEDISKKQEIDLSFLPEGVYFLRVQMDSEQKNIKVVKE